MPKTLTIRVDDETYVAFLNRAKAENRSVLAVSLEAVKTYFLEQKIKIGFMKARNKLALLPDEEGRAKLAKCHPSVFEAKKK